MLRRPSLWPIPFARQPCEGTRSRSRLAGEQTQWHVQILEKEPLIQGKCGNWGVGPFSEARRTRFGGRNLSECRFLV